MPLPDKNVAAVIKQFETRMEKGYNKYGCTTERDDLNLVEWLQHAQEEAMDFVVYLERIKGEIKEYLDWKQSYELAHTRLSRQYE